MAHVEPTLEELKKSFEESRNDPRIAQRFEALAVRLGVKDAQSEERPHTQRSA